MNVFVDETYFELSNDELLRLHIQLQKDLKEKIEELYKEAEKELGSEIIPFLKPKIIFPDVARDEHIKSIEIKLVPVWE